MAERYPAPIAVDWLTWAMARARSAAAAVDQPGVDLSGVAPEQAGPFLADALIERAAVLHRASRGAPPDELVGLRITDDEITHLLAELAGPSGRAEVDDLLQRFAPLVAAARQRFAESLGEAVPFSAVAANAALTLPEAEVLALLCAVEADPRRQRLVAYVQDDVTRTRISLQGLVALLRDVAHPAALVGPSSGPRRSALVDVDEDGPWGGHTLRVAPGLMWALGGDQSPEPELPVGTSVLTAADEHGADFVVVTGDDRVRRRQLAGAATAGTAFLVCSGVEDASAWAALVREATLTGCGVLVELQDDLPEAARRWIDRATHLPVAVTSAVELPLESMPSRPWVEVHAEATEPTDEEWKAALGDEPRTHRLTADQLRLVQRAYQARLGDLDAAVRRLASGPIDRLARRIRPTRTWADLVLAEAQMAVLHELVARYRHANVVYDQWGFSGLPSRGQVALFSGPSGTGKTLAAEIIAGELGLDVFKLDLSAVVSKYIGETEKNLDQVFDAASAGNLVLFFDEADALFGKRSEVKDARDRYANIEVSYLLQRLEAYDGMVVLATNFEKNIDDAFVRRIHARVEFPLPDVPQRRAIWDHSIPPTAPRDELDLDFLASRFDMSGGSIRNAVLHAAFIAASDGTPISTETAVRGVAREYQKLGRLLKAADFGPYLDAVTTAR
jgi:hypothetical protein